MGPFSLLMVHFRLNLRWRREFRLHIRLLFSSMRRSWIFFSCETSGNSLGMSKNPSSTSKWSRPDLNSLKLNLIDGMQMSSIYRERVRIGGIILCIIICIIFAMYSVVVPHVRFLHMGESTAVDYKLCKISIKVGPTGLPIPLFFFPYQT